MIAQKQHENQTSHNPRNHQGINVKLAREKQKDRLYLILLFEENILFIDFSH